ncbi:MAG TPA: hypothetical protein VNV86_04690 [Candidatus Acidoferrum sp.]|nr:hypothetical protein [Candidatus Acidoferrum sp.]
MTTEIRVLIGSTLLAAFAIGGFLLLRHGIYGWTMFVVAVLLGGLAAFVFDAASGPRAAMVGALTVLVSLFALLLVRIEGLICIMMAAPLALPLGALGGLLVHFVTQSRVRSRGFAMLLLMPSASLPWDVTAKPPMFAVRSSLTIAAPPEVVWRNVVTFSDLPEPGEWFFRAGLAYPQRARIVGSGPGAIRYCEFSTGPFVEPIEVWDEARLLRFRVTENPAPMHEWNPYAHVLPRHLHGYLVSKQGQFRLTALPGNRTLLEGTTWYQHGLWPAQYWRWWSDAIIHRIHLRVLTHIQRLSENS